MRHRSLFAAIEQQCAEAAPRKFRMDEECADLRGIHGRIELGGIAIAACVAAKQGAPPAPSAAPREPAAGFDDEVGAVADQLRVRAECTA